MTDVCPCFLHQPELIGLDVTFSSHCKLYIKDVISAPSLPCSCKENCPHILSSNKDVKTTDFPLFTYNGHPFYKVEILGLVVSCQERDKFYKINVDDGTGSIACCCWKEQNDTTDGSQVMSDEFADLSKSLASMLTKNRVELGDMVLVRGRKKIFRETPEINASAFEVITDPNFETSFIYRRVNAYKTVYSLPFQLPNRVARELQEKYLENQSGLKTLVCITKELKEALTDFLCSKKIAKFTVTDLVMTDNLVKVATQPCVDAKENKKLKHLNSLFREVVKTLEEDGLLFRYGTICGENSYNVIQWTNTLDKAILDILKEDSDLEKYSIEGSHYMRIMDKLNRNDKFSGVHVKCVLKCLDKLDSESKVIKVSDRHYQYNDW